MFDARVAIHITLTAIIGGIGFVLLLPADSFASASFNLMASIATEEHWGLAFYAVAAVGVVGVFVKSKGLRLVSVVTVSSAHGVYAACLAAAPVFTTGTLTYAFIAMLGYYLAWRRSVEGV